MPTPRICSVEGCGNRHEAKGFCRLHYKEWRRAAAPRCSVDGCDRVHDARGFCITHYGRWKKYGDPLIGSTAKGAPMAFIRDVLLNTTSNACIAWPFGTRDDGRGIFHHNGWHGSASRAVCAIAHGPPPTPEHHAAHSCGKGHLGCVNPRHIRWATPKENMADQLIHGTRQDYKNMARGERVSTAKLTEDDVRQIRALKGIKKRIELARMFGIDPTQVWNIQTGRHWRHIKP